MPHDHPMPPRLAPREHTESGRGSRAASATSTAQSRRMNDRLDESGAPVQDGMGRAGAPSSPPITGAGLGQPMGNAQTDPEAAIQEEIRLKAYQRWVTRGGPPNTAEDDWVEAEKEVRGKLWTRGSGTEPGL